MIAESWKKLWRPLLKVTVSAALMVVLLRRMSLSELVDVVRGLDLSVLTIAAICFLVSNILGSFQWYQLLNASGVPLTFGRTFRFYFIGLFFNNFLPANIGGDAVKIYDVTRVGSSVYNVVAVTFLDRLLGIFGLCSLAAISTVWLWRSLGPDPYGYYGLIFVACMLPAVGFYFFKPLGNLLRRAVLKIRPLSIDERVSAVLDHLGEFKARRLLVVRLVGLSVVIQALRVSTHILVGVALGIEMTTVLLVQFFVFIPLLSLAMIPPITINGLGVREGLGIVLFATAGLGETDAFTLEFLTYIISVSVSLLGLLFFVMRGGRRQQGEIEPDAV